MIPIAGSAYTYTYATLGELVAWIIGWDLILEYAGSNMTVSVGFGAHVVDFLDWFGLQPPLKWITPAYLSDGMTDLRGNTLYNPGWHFGFNIPAFLIVLLLTVILVRGIRESASVNNAMVGIKIVAILIFVMAVLGYLHPANWHPYMPNGWSGVLTAVYHIFHLHRLRFRLHGCRGVPESAARPAHRHHRHADCLYSALSCGCREPDWPGALAIDGR